MDKEQRAAYEEAKDRARQREFVLNLDDVAKPVSMGIGLAPYEGGQATTVSIKAKGSHTTVGAVHVAVTEGEKIVVAIEVGPDTEFELRPIVRRGPWRFRDYWTWDEDKHDNVLKAEWAWPSPPAIIEEIGV